MAPALSRRSRAGVLFEYPNPAWEEQPHLGVESEATVEVWQRGQRGFPCKIRAWSLKNHNKELVCSHCQARQRASALTLMGPIVLPVLAVLLIFKKI